MANSGILVQVKADIIDIDWKVDFARAAQVFKDTNTAVSGNFNPAGAILLGKVPDVEAEIRRCIDQAQSAGSAAFMIAGGCEIPAAAPDENLLAMNRILYC